MHSIERCVNGWKNAFDKKIKMEIPLQKQDLDFGD